MKQNNILEKLNLSPEAYQAGVFAVYFEWCESLSINQRELQSILANAAIARWYSYELEKCEAEFHRRTNRYCDSPSISQDDYRVCYEDCVQKLFNLRPMALLQEVKQNRHPAGIKLQNSRIPTLSFNQN